jgi:hemoglobin/transferrin/lactoferrin receptor protein
MLKLIIFTSLILSCLSSLASYELETILHTQNQTEAENSEENQHELDTLSEDDLQGINSSSASIDDILRLTVGATTARGPRSSGESVQVRGMSDNKVFVMIDGSRQNFQAGHSSMVALDTENLKAVEIYKSPSNISNVGNIGGGVNFITKDATDLLSRGKSNGSEFKTQHSTSNDENFYNGKAVFVKDAYSGYLSLSTAKAGNLNLNDGETLGHSSYEDFSSLLKLKYKNFDFKYEFFQRKDDAPENPTLNPPDEITSLFTTNTTTKKNISLKYASTNLFNWHIYRNDYMIEKTYIDDNKQKSWGIETFGVKANKQFSSWNIGTEFYDDKLLSDYEGSSLTDYPDSASGNNITGYVEKNINLTDSILLSPGVSHTSYNLSSSGVMPNKKASAVTKKIKSVYQINKYEFHATYSEGFNAPRVNEVFPSGLHSEGDGWFIRDNYFIPNEDLKHETSEVSEVGVRFSDSILNGNGLLEFQVNIFENKIKDYIHMERIDRSIVDTENGSTQFINIPNVSMYGTELELKLMYDAFDYKLTFSQVRGRNETDDLFLEDLPADQYNFHFKYHLDKYFLTLGYLGHYSQEQNRVNVETTQRTDKTGSYLIHNIFMSKSFDNINIDFRIDNLQNRKYRKHASHLYESERDYKIALKYKINTI